MSYQLPIDTILQYGQALNLSRSQPMDNIRSVVRSLFIDLHQAKVDYMLVGGVALLSYIEGRNTQDIALVIEPTHMHKLPWQASKQDNDFGTAVYQGLKVDLLLTSNPLFAYVEKNERTMLTFDNLTIPCATREGLLLLKLYALPSLYRQGKMARAALYEADILMLGQGASIDEEQLLSVLGHHLAQHDIAELRKILEEQRTRRRFTD